ncbi:MAG: vitamin K epoxide reductase family protein [Gemmatimonadota bacterium]
MTAATHRKAIAVLALAGLFLSTYLLLFKLGIYGELICGEGGSCDLVQASSYATFLGVPVAGWGTAWYAVVFGLAVTALQPRLAGARWPGSGLLALATIGLLFSAYLTGVELFVLHAICRWCVASAGITLGIFGLAVTRRS